MFVAMVNRDLYRVFSSCFGFMPQFIFSAAERSDNATNHPMLVSTGRLELKEVLVFFFLDCFGTFIFS